MYKALVLVVAVAALFVSGCNKEDKACCGTCGGGAKVEKKACKEGCTKPCCAKPAAKEAAKPAAKAE